MTLRLPSRPLAQVAVEPLVLPEAPGFEPFDPAASDVDFCITLGGDGTVLHLVSLFVKDEPLPPCLSFAMGSLGFLTPFNVSDFKNCLERVLGAAAEPLACTLRTRKRCEVRLSESLVRVHHVLNEAVLDRGAFSSAVFFECFIDGGFVTAIEVQHADWL